MPCGVCSHSRRERPTAAPYIFLGHHTDSEPVGHLFREQNTIDVYQRTPVSVGPVGIPLSGRCGIAIV